MKKNLEKIFASASVVIAVILIMLLIVTAFGGIDFDDFQNKLVRGLIITLGILYIILSSTTLTLLFMSNDATKEIVLRTEQNGSVRTTLGVVHKMTKETAVMADGVKCGRVMLFTNEYGVRLRVEIRIKDKDVTETELLVRTLLEDKFMGALGFRFNAIEIKVVALHSKYEVDKTAVDEKVAGKIAAIKEEAAKAETEAAAKEADGVIVIDETEDAEADSVSITDAANDIDAEMTVDVETPEEEVEVVSEENADEELTEKAVAEEE